MLRIEIIGIFVIIEDNCIFRGYSFVTLATEEAAEAAISELDGRMVGGRPLKVERAREKRRADDDDGAGRGGRGSYRQRHFLS